MRSRRLKTNYKASRGGYRHTAVRRTRSRKKLSTIKSKGKKSSTRRTKGKSSTPKVIGLRMGYRGRRR